MNDLELMINNLTARFSNRLAELEKENNFLTFELIKTKEALKNSLEESNKLDKQNKGEK
jgi:hypothetical protein